MAQKTFSLPYREEPYQITATRKFYHPQTKTVSVNPTTPNPSLSFELVRKTGDWIYYEDSEVLPYGRTVVEDINVEPEDSYISQPGVDGLREFSEEREWIDGEWTGETRNYTETITQPVNEIYIQGTAPHEITIETILTQSNFNHTSTYIMFDYIPELLGEDIIRIEINSMVATGTWRAYGQPSMAITFSPNAEAVFGTTFTTLPSGTPLYLTYQP